MIAPETLLYTFDVDTIPTEALMFQAGYLTIDSARYFPGRLELQGNRMNANIVDPRK